MSSILRLVRPKMFLDKLDSNDVYYIILIEESQQKLLKFKFEGIFYKFLCSKWLYCRNKEILKITETSIGNIEDPMENSGSKLHR